ncbi:hypothetical protein [Methylomonas methanica]|uniref:Circularly permuted ATP-grasp superfamily protein n=1 Tax=Methylomonas methanica (strain DSM 25384 / MC09) TaxID=857087 RepID=F9ZXP9_METMM|nr:hypothetical protein [Methylomonas methanica]AEG02204.1 hypothetical protein Metme_3849 [Methylomonas methanica MC09]
MTVFDNRLGLQRAQQLNRDCHCLSLDRRQLRQALSVQPQGDSLCRMICEDRPHMISDVAVFVAETNLQKQRDIINAIESVIALPAYQERALAYAPPSARFQPKARGVFLGYDFHLDDDGPKLIEINTNAGGALINLLLTKAHTACESCPCQLDFSSSAQDAEQAIIDMFYAEWRLEGHRQPLQTIAIVDEDPNQQYMLPEFLLFQNLFAKHGLRALICDPEELTLRDGKLWHGDTAIDLVYNRLTDFGLELPAQQTLLQAYLASAVVVTPHPRNHALYADKRNLALLTDPEALLAMEVDPATQNMLLQGIAKTTRVEDRHADDLWRQRKQLFFKPAKGYGSKAAYRGDKLTRRVFGEILQTDYVAQTLVQPSERQLQIGDQPVELKLDLRHYVYHGQTQTVCARLYQGQTTNFRTPGGGFAQVVVVPQTAKFA